MLDSRREFEKFVESTEGPTIFDLLDEMLDNNGGGGGGGDPTTASISSTTSNISQCYCLLQDKHTHPYQCMTSKMEEQIKKNQAAHNTEQQEMKSGNATPLTITPPAQVAARRPQQQTTEEPRIVLQEQQEIGIIGNPTPIQRYLYDLPSSSSSYNQEKKAQQQTTEPRLVVQGHQDMVRISHPAIPIHLYNLPSSCKCNQDKKGQHQNTEPRLVQEQDMGRSNLIPIHLYNLGGRTDDG